MQRESTCSRNSKEGSMAAAHWAKGDAAKKKGGRSIREGLQALVKTSALSARVRIDFIKDMTLELYLFLIKKIFIDVRIQLSPFSHHHFPLLYPLRPFTLNPTPLWLCPWVPHSCSFMTLSLLPMLFPSPHPWGYCQFVVNFNVSGYILLACLFCWLGSNYRWDDMVFVFHHLSYFT